MTILVANVLLQCFWGLILLRKGCERKGLFCAISSFQLFFISGFRAWNVGSDLDAYQNHFYITSFEDPFDVLGRLLASLWGKDAGVGLEPGYDLFILQPIHALGGDFQWLLLFVAGIVSLSAGRFIYKFSDNALISFIILSTVFPSILFLGAMRQAVAIALVVFWGYDYVVRRRFVPFAMITLLAFTIHPSAAIFLPFYFLYQIKVTTRIYLIGIMLVLVTIPVSRVLFPYVAGFFGYDSFTYDYVGRSTVVYAGLFALVTMVVFFYERALFTAWQVGECMYGCSFVRSLGSALRFCKFKRTASSLVLHDASYTVCSDVFRGYRAQIAPLVLDIAFFRSVRLSFLHGSARTSRYWV